MSRTRWIIAGILLATVIVEAYRIVTSSGLLVTIEPHPLRCTAIPGVVGAEDITIDPRNGLAYVSSDDRRATQRGQPVAGAIYAIDLSEAHPVPRLLWRGSDASFHLHGISLFVGAGSDPVLMAINHGVSDRHTIERFIVRGPDQLEHVASLAFTSLISPNDIVASGPRSFYVTNDHGYPPGWRQTLEDYLGLPFANIVYFDGETARVAATGFTYANGINLSGDGAVLVVAETTGRRIRVFDRDPVTGALEPRASIDVDTGADNLEWAPGGALLVAGHPRLFDFLAHAADPTRHSPSQVLSVALGPTPRITELYMDDGSEISGASVAAIYGRRMLIGAVFEEKVLLCEL